jgi:hypothetical protein
VLMFDSREMGTSRSSIMEKGLFGKKTVTRTLPAKNNMLCTKRS